MPRTSRMLISDEKTAYHVISRTALDGFPFRDVEKEALRVRKAAGIKSGKPPEPGNLRSRLFYQMGLRRSLLRKDIRQLKRIYITG